MPDDLLPDQRPPTEGAWSAGSQRETAGNVVAAVAVYFGVVLAVVAALGPLRQFFVSAGADALLASLAEATAVALAMTYASGWATRVFAVPARLPARLIVGAGAMGLLCAVTGLAVLLAGMSAREGLSLLTTAPGLVAVLTVALGAVLPLARARE